MKLWCFDDEGGWGRLLLQEAIGRGHDANLFKDAAQPDSGVVFMRMNHQPKVRGRDKAIMAALAHRRDLQLIPDYRSSVLYDDKVEQARQLAAWMPATAVVHSKGAARIALEDIGLPLISKAAEGASSHNVRLVDTEDRARKEMRLAFDGGEGIRCYKGQRQTGYLLWQEFLAGNDYDFRVIAIGRERMILRRGNRDDRPMASGSNREMPVTFPDAEAEDVLAFADRFFAEERFRWCGIDVVRDHRRNEWKVLETTVAWPLKNLGAHRFVSGRSGNEFWAVAMSEIEAGAFW